MNKEDNELLVDLRNLAIAELEDSWAMFKRGGVSDEELETYGAIKIKRERVKALS